MWESFVPRGVSVRNPAILPVWERAKCPIDRDIRESVRIPDRNVCVRQPDILPEKVLRRALAVG
ncbi:hypothetical protein FHS01_001450 [Longimicrobium terrae]|uniref:Uncharacterized protein n=1 Tax=Longimicrobium terrae TaxID=1639882 RepID=A0A841GQN9_9BACT|nr:hypothetical protein [Longimicrobium terrae]MBB6069832.1 hypothetical protein [Longimicrobium terrae]